MEVENEHLKFMKSVQQFDADKTEENQKNPESQANTPLDLGFPEEDDQNADGIL